MTVIAAINQEGMLVMLEDERVLPITGLYASSGHLPLTTTSKLSDDLKVETWEEAEVFTVGFPDQPGVVLICSIEGISVAKGDAN